MRKKRSFHLSPSSPFQPALPCCCAVTIWIHLFGSAKKIISLDSCSLIKLYNGRRCRKLRISQISRVPEKIQYQGKNTSWQWWLHQRVLSRITFLTELSSESLLTAPKSNMERPVFLTVWNKALHMSQTERKNSSKDKDCLIWSIVDWHFKSWC